MKLFENKVGRPSNETLNKRRSFIYMAVFAAASALTAGSIFLTSNYAISELNKLNTSEKNLLNNINLSKIKGEIINAEKLSGNVFSTERNGNSEDNQVTGVEKERQKMMNNISSTYFIEQDGLEKFKISNYANDMYVTNKLADLDLSYSIENKNNKKIYFAIELSYDSESKLLYSDIVEAKSLFGGKQVFNILKEKLNTLNYNILNINIYFSDEKIVNLTGLNALKQDQLTVYYDKNLFVHDFELPENVWKSVKILDFKSENNNVFYNLEAKNYLKVPLNLHLYNADSKDKYYRWFTYKNNSVSKSSLNFVGSCTKLKSSSEKIYIPTLTVNESMKNRTGVIKVYNDLSSCNSDLLGQKNNNIKKIQFNVKSNVMPSVNKNNMSIKVNNITKNSVDFSATTSASTFKSCTIYKSPASTKSVVTRYPNARANYSKTKKVTIKNSKLKPNTNYEIQCASNGKITTLKFKTLNK